MEKEAQQPLHLKDIPAPIVQVGQIFGQPLMVQLSGFDAEEREVNFVKTRATLAKVFDASNGDTDNISDGYHTFGELYHYRMLYNAAFFNMIAGQAEYDVHKSRFHSDGTPAFGGEWFVVVAYLPTGQITNHYKLEDWDYFNVEERIRAAEWDGHTPADAAKRLEDFLLAREN